MKILGFDTSSDTCTVALIINHQLFARSERGSQHSEHLLELVDSVLGEAGTTLAQLDAIAFGRGPGSFTGLRIGAGVAQGLAFAAGLQLIPVSSLQVLAQGVESNRIVTAVDARMAQVYWCAFERDQSGIAQPIITEQVLAPEAIEVPPGPDWVGVGSGWSAYEGQLRPRADGRVHVSESNGAPEARHLISIAAAVWRLNGAVVPEAGIPVYVRDQVAEKSRRGS